MGLLFTVINHNISVLFWFIFSIIRRLLTLINEEAKSAAQCEAYKKQAESATEAAKRLMEEKDNTVNKVNLNNSLPHL
jgi:B-cell receptor-associated protein 31